jgi:DNA polymerase-3 subunit delta'
VSLHALVGHDELRASLVRAHRADALPDALLLHGARGVGKQHLALWLARLTVCVAPTDEGPCDRCGPCRMSLSLEHPDVHWYVPLPRPKGTSRDRLADALERARHDFLADVRAESLRMSWSDEVRAIYLGTVANLRRAASRRPTMADGPVFIVGQAEMLVPQEASQEAANALLKLLEEPPGRARFILTSSEPGMLLPTIRSRTVPLHVPSLSVDAVQTLLEERAGVEPKVAAWAARLSQGSPGRALGFLPDGEDLGPLERMRRQAYEIVTASFGSGHAAGFAVALGFPPAGARSLLELFSFVEEWLRDLAAVASGADERVFNHDAGARLRKHVETERISAVALTDAFASVERARELARGNVNPQLVVSGLVRDIRGALRRAAPSPTGVPA